jgi:hypothetical protein
MGKYQQIHDFNLENNQAYDPGLYSFARWSAKEKLLIVVNFNQNTTVKSTIKIPSNLIKTWGLKDGTYPIKDQLYQKYQTNLVITNGEASIQMELKPLESFIFKI